MKLQGFLQVKISRKNAILVSVLFLSFLVRLYNVDTVIIGRASWRQADTAAMAKNFLESGFNILYPQVDWGGNTPGYVECEFPLYPFLTAILYQLFGFSEIWARLLSAIASVLTIYFLFKLVRDILSYEIAIWSAFFFGFLPLQVYYSRTVMPESFMLFSTVLGCYLFHYWTQTESKKHLFLSALFISLACLLKITSLYIGLPLLFLAWNKYGSKTFRKKFLWVYALSVLAPVALWYYHAHNILLSGGLTFGIWEYGVDKWGNWNMVVSWSYWNRIIFQSLAERHFTWVGFIVFIVGLSLRRQMKEERVFDVWLIAVIVYFVIVAKGNAVHEYYQLPFMIPGVVFLGKVFGRHLTFGTPWNRIKIVLSLSLVIIISLSVWRYSTYMKLEDETKSIDLKLAEVVKSKTPQKALVGIIDLGDPTLLYLANRKGWHLSVDEITSGRIEVLSRSGLEYIGGVSSFLSEQDWSVVEKKLSEFELVSKDGEVFLYRIKRI